MKKTALDAVDEPVDTFFSIKRLDGWSMKCQ